MIAAAIAHVLESSVSSVEREWRYKAKAVIDTFVYRSSDVVFAWMHKGLAAFGSQVVFLAGIAFAGAMTFGAWRVVRAQRNLPSDDRPGVKTA